MFLGRVDERKRGRDAIAQNGLVVLSGPGGIGKTSLGRELLAGFITTAEGGALATLAWEPFLVFQRLTASAVGNDPAAVASTVVNRSLDAVLLDDLQWADEASLEVIAELVGRLAIVTTVRTGEPRSAFTLEALSMLNAVEIPLRPLDPPDARRLIAAAHPDLDRASQDRVLADADGNPLLLIELPYDRSDASSLTSALAGRLEALDEEALHAIRRLAVLGRPAEPALLGPGTEKLAGAKLVESINGRVSMTHQVIAERIIALAGEQANVHRRELAALVDAAEAAHLLAAAGDHVAARDSALKGAREAEAVRRAELMELAISCGPPGSLDAELRIEAAQLFFDLSQPVRSAALCDVDGVDDLDALQRGSLRSIAGLSAWLTGHVDRCQELLDLAMADLDGTDSAAQVQALAGSTLIASRVEHDGRPVLERARYAVELADRIGQQQHFARSRLASVLLTSGEPGWDPIFREVIESSSALGDTFQRRTAATGLALAHWIMGNSAEALRVALDDIDYGPQHDHDSMWLSMHGYAAMIALSLGVDRKVILSRHRPTLEAEPIFRGRMIMAGSLGLCLLDLGRPDEAAALVNEARRIRNARIHDIEAAAWFDAEYAWATKASGASAASAPLGPDRGNPALLASRLTGAHAVREAGQVTLDGPRPIVAFPAWQGALTEWDALVAACAGDHRRAVELFDTATKSWKGNDVRSMVRCCWAAGDEAQRARLDDAEQRLLRARDLAHKWGLAPIAERARSALRLMGKASRIPSQSGPIGLTSREEQILRLVGAGLSSKQIAAQLSLSASTIDSVVRTAVRKLGASNRLAATAMLAAEGGVADESGRYLGELDS